MTEIKQHDESSIRCLSCDALAQTEEHVFPGWLQRRFKLHNQKITLPNGTNAPYRQLRVPMCATCNNEIYSAMEDRLSRGTESDLDVWLWCNKVHYGLINTHRRFDLERSDPHKGKISDFVDGRHVLDWDRKFLRVATGEVSTHPSPFGSVFRFDFGSDQGYDFAHILFSFAIMISFGDRGYVVFLTDGQIMRDDVAIGQLWEHLASERIANCSREIANGVPMERFAPGFLDASLGIYDMKWFFAQCLEFLARQVITIPVAQTSNSILKIGSGTLRKAEPVNPERFAVICEALGFTWRDIDKGDAG